MKYDQIDVEPTIGKLSLEDKVRLIAGTDFWHTAGVPELGIPPLRMSDGPNGVRGTRFFAGTPSSCFPCGTGLASSFDPEFMVRVGKALGEESRAKSAHVLLGPTLNGLRSPTGGRGFESYSEDPYLSGMIAAAYVNGVESMGVAATPKHYVANDQEFERFSSSSEVCERALREIYLEPFRMILKYADPKCFMTAYNRVNGTHVSESPYLLDQVLRKEWGFKGLAMSDWTGVYTTAESIKAGLDIEMPGPSPMRGGAVNRALQAGNIRMKDIDNLIRRILNLCNHAIKNGIPFGGPEQSIKSAEMSAILREAAANAIILLKNDKKALPLSSKDTKSIAVIGGNAKQPVPSGGGSASMLPTYVVTPLEAITAAGKEQGINVEFAAGASAFRYMPVIEGGLTDPTTGASGSRMEVWKDCPMKDWWKDSGKDLRTADFVESNSNTLAFMIDGVPWDKLGEEPYVRLSWMYEPDVSGEFKFGLASIGLSSLFVDGKLVVDNVNGWKNSELFFTLGSEERHGVLKLEKGKKYFVEARGFLPKDFSVAAPFTMRPAFRVGALLNQTAEAAREEAVALASKSDVAVVVVGTNGDWESEGYDRKDINIPGESNALVEAVLKANPRTIVVTQSGMPLAMPWVDSAPTLVQAMFGGNEVGNGLADVLFGKVAPSGKLPMTFPLRYEDNPAYNSFGITTASPGKAIYGEGVFVGYRHYDRAGKQVLFPFGHGLSYSDIEVSDLKVGSIKGSGADTTFDVTYKVSNVGKVDTKYTTQVYVAPPVEGRITSPPKELKAFQKVSLKAGASTTVTLTLGKEAFSYWDEPDACWIAPAGTYRVLVGHSSADLPLSGEVKLEKTFEWLGL